MIISIMDSCMKLETLSEEFAPKVFSDRSLLQKVSKLFCGARAAKRVSEKNKALARCNYRGFET